MESYKQQHSQQQRGRRRRQRRRQRQRDLVVIQSWKEKMISENGRIMTLQSISLEVQTKFLCTH